EAGNAEDGGIALEDFRERFADDRADARARKSLWRVLARGSRSEVSVHDQDGRAGVARIAERMRRIRGAIVLEQMLLETIERYRNQEPRRHDSIGVDVVAAQRHAAA